MYIYIYIFIYLYIYRDKPRSAHLYHKVARSLERRAHHGVRPYIYMVYICMCVCIALN